MGTDSSPGAIMLEIETGSAALRVGGSRGFHPHPLSPIFSGFWDYIPILDWVDDS